MERVPILSCKIWHGQENNGNCGIAAIKGLFMLDRQGVSRWV